MSRRNDEDRYMEFQLEGKQLLIVLAGVVLLCGISFYFGRRVGRAEAAGEPSPVLSLMGEEQPLEEEDAGVDLTFFDTVGAEPKAAAPLPVASGSSAAVKPARPAAEKPPVATTATRAPSPTPPSTTTSPTRSPPPVVGSGFEIQVAVLSEHSNAESLASRLRGKGYTPRISTTESGGKTRYRVRVTGYPSRAEAELAAARLEREEKLNTWIPPQGG